MNVAFAVAALVAGAGAAIHGIAGERLVVRKLRVETLAPTPFGGPGTTLSLIRGSWHIVTATFLATAVGLGACAGVGSGGTCRGVGLLTAGLYSALTLGVVVRAIRGHPSSLLRHPGPVAFAAVAALSWLGL